MRVEYTSERVKTENNYPGERKRRQGSYGPGKMGQV